MKLSRHPSRGAGRDLHIIKLQHCTAREAEEGGTLAMVGSFSLCFAHLGNDPPPDDDITPQHLAAPSSISPEKVPHKKQQP